MEQMKLGWKFISRIKSNTILVIDKNLPMTRGIGSGQTSRIRSAKIALEQAGKHAKGGILISDSFFPFDDTVKLSAKVGITCILQQGGSVRDNLSIEAANKAGISMVLTGERKFWH
jgi:phosphoribosylaminoimidazolecarboxamide formyltransferase/IMP cyclohydrolase